MKRRSQPKVNRTKGTYSAKKSSGNMMYGPTKHKTYGPRESAIFNAQLAASKKPRKHFTVKVNNQTTKRDLAKAYQA